MMKTKVRFCKVRSPQIKKCKKETSFKIQFYIGIHLSGIVLGCFSDLSAMSPSPTGYRRQADDGRGLSAHSIVLLMVKYQSHWTQPDGVLYFCVSVQEISSILKKIVSIL